MFDHIDRLLATTRSPMEDLRLHRVELIELRRRREAGLEIGPELAPDQTRVAANELAALPLLRRVREAWDGPLVLMKGPEVALDYGGPGLRSFGDLDLLTDDAESAQAALIEAGFQEVFDPEVFEDIHHLRPLWWPGLPLVVELHSRPNWPAGFPGPSTAELLAAAVPTRLGIDGLSTLPPAHHTLLLAAHAWAHQPLGRLGNLLDVVVSLRRADEAEVAALARRWGCSRLWRTTRSAARDVVEGRGRSAAVRLWGRHLIEIRERTVLEWHLHRILGPAWALPRRRVPGAVTRAVLHDVRRARDEPWRLKLVRARLALANAGTSRSAHVETLKTRGFSVSQFDDA